MSLIELLQRPSAKIGGKAMLPFRIPAIIDKFVLALGATILAAAVLPCRGTIATIFHGLGIFAISSLFFLQGARLSRSAVVNGITHWKLHTTIGLTTFVVFPLLGVALWAAEPMLLPNMLWLGVIYVCTLPSTVQSSIALTSIAGGNVAGAICSATLSNIIGIALTPLIFGAITSMRHDGSVNVSGILWVMLQILVPFAAGHLTRPWIGAWAERNRAILAVTDRGSILLVSYTAFSAAVINGIWHQVPFVTLIALLLLTGSLLTAILLVVTLTGRALGFVREDTIAALFCGSQKSLVSGVPIANVLFPPAIIGAVLLPTMIYYPLQLAVCGVLAKAYARSAAKDAVQFGRAEQAMSDTTPGIVPGESCAIMVAQAVDPSQ